MHHQQSVYIEGEHKELVTLQQQLLKKGFKEMRNTGAGPYTYLFVGDGLTWLTTVTGVYTDKYQLPQDQQTVYQLLDLPLPKPDFKVGDRIKVVANNWTANSPDHTGQTGTIRKVQTNCLSIKLDNSTSTLLFNTNEVELLSQSTNNMKFNIGDRVKVLDGAPSRIGKEGVITEIFEDLNRVQVLIGSSDSSRFDVKQLEKVGEAEPNIIYLSGTPGQLEGFRQDWVKVGYDSIGHPITEESKVICLDFQGRKPSFRGQLDRSEAERCPKGPILSVMENWQKMLDRAAEQQKTNVAPIKLAGHDVKLEGSELTIGCRRVGKEKAKLLLDNVHEVNRLLGYEGKDVTIPQLLQVREWLLSK